MVLLKVFVLFLVARFHRDWELFAVFIPASDDIFHLKGPILSKITCTLTSKARGGADCDCKCEVAFLLIEFSLLSEETFSYLRANYRHVGCYQGLFCLVQSVKHDQNKDQDSCT